VGSRDHLEKARKDRSTASLMMMFVGFLRGAQKRRVGSQLGIIVQARPALQTMTMSKLASEELVKQSAATFAVQMGAVVAAHPISSAMLQVLAA